jgi:hypothetical protein
VRYMRRLAGSALAGAAALLAVSGGAFGAANAASAAKLPTLPIGDLKQVIADGVHNRVYLATTGGVVVTNMTGAHVTTLAGESVSHVALSPDGNTLFAVLPGADEVAAYSAKTLAAGLLYKLPAGDAVGDIALQAGKIWVSYATAAGGAIGSFTVGNTKFTPASLTTAGVWPAAPRLAADLDPDGTLVAVDGEADPSMIATYNVNGGNAPVAENDAFAACTGLSDIAVAAGGGSFDLACTGSATELHFSKALAAAVDYASGAGTDAVAIAPDNSGTATGNNDAATAKLATFKANGAAENAYPLAADGYTVAPDGLSWTSDATKLVAVLKAGANYALDVVEYAQYKASSLDLTSPKLYWQAGTKVILRGTLKLGGAAAPAGTTVKIFRQVVGSSVLTTLTAHTGAGGAYTYTDTPPKYAHYYYTAYYATTGTYAPNWHSCLVVVNPLHTTLRLTAPGAVAGGTTVQVTAHLGKTYNSRYVSIYAQPAGGAKKLVKKAKVNSAGNLAISYKVTANTTFTAVFAGDAHYASVTAKATVHG